MKKIVTMLSVGLVAGSVFAGLVFEGKDGLVVMEVESTTSEKGQWKEMKTIEGFTGDCHFEFTGNKPATGPAKDPMEYTFTVDKDGVYRLMIRCHKRLEDEKPDKCNDCYVKLIGDFDTGGDAPLEVLKADTKLYGGAAKGWGWSNKLDVSHKKYQPLYKLKKGQQYTLVISGRSQRYNMDRIVIRHESLTNEKAQDPKLPESARK